MKKVLFSLLVLSMVLTLGLLQSSRATADEKKLSISAVMKQAHLPKRKSLKDRVVAGKADDAEKKKLLELYEALAKCTPDKGTKESWKKRTGALVSAAKDVVAGKEGARGALGRAASCGSCHRAHK